jgi:hypothetical protein
MAELILDGVSKAVNLSPFDTTPSGHGTGPHHRHTQPFWLTTLSPRLSVSRGDPIRK